MQGFYFCSENIFNILLLKNFQYHLFSSILALQMNHLFSTILALKINLWNIYDYRDIASNNTDVVKVHRWGPLPKKADTPLPPLDGWRLYVSDT